MNQHKATDWKVFFPDQGETIEDAEVLRIYHWQNIHDAEDAAQHACEFDYDNRDGWERGRDNSFSIAIISPTGAETRWTGSHEPSVVHTVSKMETED